MEFKNRIILQLLIVALCLILGQQAAHKVNSFKQMGQHHCSQFPVQLLWRLSTGLLSQKYGEQYYQYDCYIRQFLKKDGITIFEDIPSDGQDESEEDSESQDQQKADTELKIDPIVKLYAEGVRTCLPKDVDSIEAVYAIWRFIRFVVQHDYAFEWMRAKIRSGMGYEAEKPSAWMDGQSKAQRLRLDKLFSNQFYQYVDELMFKDFLYPIMTFLKKNTVLALSGELTQSGKPIIVQSLQTHNYLENIFTPIILQDEENDIFAYTIPGIPLLLSGSNSLVSWAFTGVLVDRSNVQQIQTVNNKFYNHETQQWIPLTTQELTIPGVPDKVCTFIYSSSGTLYTKHNVKGKVSEYISKWHEDEKQVRAIFSGVYNLIKNNGVLAEQQSLQFPFNSIILVNNTGIFQYLCPQFYPSYFLYPDMFGEPQKIDNRWITYTKKYVAVSNTQLTTTKQESYRKGQILSPTQEQIAIEIRRYNPKANKFSLVTAMEFVKKISTLPYVKKQRQMLTSIYRKVKFIYFPQENIRKQCDQLISILEKWDNSLTHKQLAPIYILWEYFYRDYTFNYVSSSEYGLHIARHKAISELYWSNQMALWQKGTSYGECESHEYQQKQHEYNGTGQNSTCYFNIMRGINRTRQILFEKYNGDLGKINLDDFSEKKIIDLSEGRYKGSDVEEAFGVYYSRNLFFGAEIGSKKVRYSSVGFKQSEQFDQIIGDGSSGQEIQADPVNDDL